MSDLSDSWVIVEPHDDVPFYATFPEDPTGPKTCCSLSFRHFDPYCPQFYRCKDYATNAHWFDGEDKADLRVAIDFDSDSMDRLPDVRPYLYYMGYWGHWELEGATPPLGLETCDRAQTEDAYVKLGREYLKSQRSKGYGYFLGDKDWAQVIDKLGGVTWSPFRETPRTEEVVGFEDYHDGMVHFDCVAFTVLKTNLRSPMPLETEVRTRPGDDDWDLYIKWLYDKETHGVAQVIHYHCDWDCVYQTRLENDAKTRFMEH